MSIFERFRSVFSSTEIELACSLPVCNLESEVLFFYSTQPNDAVSFVFEAIWHAYMRDINSGDIIEITESLLKSSKATACNGSIIRPSFVGEKAYEMKDMYESIYEDYYQYLVMKRNDTLFSNTCYQLKTCFERLVPEGPLKELYEEIGQEFFSILRKNSGQS